MNSSLPKAMYRVNDSTELDDLVIWAKQSCSSTYQENPAFRKELCRFLKQNTTTRYFAGPLDHQIEIDPTEVAPTSFPVVIHIQLGPDTASKAFLYLTDNTTEFHLPERFAVTGDLDEDNRRRELIRGLAEGIEKLTGSDWKVAEYGGIATTIDDYDKFWTKYWENAFERVDYEYVGE